MYALMGEKVLDPMPVCVVSEHPELERVLQELGIKDSALTLNKPITAVDLFNVVTIVADRKKQLRLEQESSGVITSPSGKKEVVIPKSVLGAKILLAEDNKINQMVATELLKLKGFEPTVADNGRIVLELLKTQQFDLILMDVQMPEMDGFETTRAIRADAQFAHLPILAMTANAMSGDRDLCLAAGMNAHIAKPIDPDTLYRTLVKWIQK
jgi:CheY-like chemotaxis protein